MRDIPGREGIEYVAALLNNFDLDICRVAIFNNVYIKKWVWLKMLINLPNISSRTGEKGNFFKVYMEHRTRSSNGESVDPDNHSYRNFVARAVKYANRLNLQHFPEYAVLLGDM